jgi:hypothetical protein
MTTLPNFWQGSVIEDSDTLYMDVPVEDRRYTFIAEALIKGHWIPNGTERYIVAEITTVIEGREPFAKVTFRRLTVSTEIKMIPGPAILISAKGDYDRGDETSFPFGIPGFKITCNQCGSKKVTILSDVGFSAMSGAWGGVRLSCSDCHYQYEIWHVS